MTSANVELVRRVFEYGPDAVALLRRGDDVSAHPWLLLWHPECVLEELADMPDAAAYHGREGVLGYFQQLPEVWDEIAYTPVDLVEGTRVQWIRTPARTSQSIQFGTRRDPVRSTAASRPR